MGLDEYVVCSTVWFYFGAVGSFIFIIIQLILLIDFAYSWNKVWVENAEDGENKGWFAGTRLTITWFFFILNVIYYLTLQLLLVDFYIDGFAFIEVSDLQMYLQSR